MDGGIALHSVPYHLLGNNVNSFLSTVRSYSPMSRTLIAGRISGRKLLTPKLDASITLSSVLKSLFRYASLSETCLKCIKKLLNSPLKKKVAEECISSNRACHLSLHFR